MHHGRVVTPDSLASAVRHPRTHLWRHGHRPTTTPIDMSFRTLLTVACQSPSARWWPEQTWRGKRKTAWNDDCRRPLTPCSPPCRRAVVRGVRWQAAHEAEGKGVVRLECQETIKTRCRVGSGAVLSSVEGIAAAGGSSHRPTALPVGVGCCSHPVAK